MASPLSSPGTPRTSSPLAFEDDVAQSLPSSPDAAHSLATHREFDEVWPSPVAVPNAIGASTTVDGTQPLQHAPKGKGKAVRGPLRLLDLPVDVLKEIIHQVRLASLRLHIVAHRDIVS